MYAIPFNIKGCIVSDGDGTLPTDWRASEIVTIIEVKSMKADNGK